MGETTNISIETGFIGTVFATAVAHNLTASKLDLVSEVLYISWLCFGAGPYWCHRCKSDFGQFESFSTATDQSIFCMPLYCLLVLLISNQVDFG